MSALVFVGIDVSQARLDIAARPGTSSSPPHHESAIAAAVEQLRALSPTLIVLEATGGMEIPLTSALATAGLPVVVVTPRQVRDFAKASGRLAQTDVLDAQVLAQFATTSGCEDTGAGCAVDPATATGGNAHGREESPAECGLADPQAGSYCVA